MEEEWGKHMQKANCIVLSNCTGGSGGYSEITVCNMGWVTIGYSNSTASWEPEYWIWKERHVSIKWRGLVKIL